MRFVCTVAVSGVITTLATPIASAWLTAVSTPPVIQATLLTVRSHSVFTPCASISARTRASLV